MSLPPLKDRRGFIKCASLWCAGLIVGGCERSHAPKVRQGKISLVHKSKIGIGVHIYALERIALLRDDEGVAAMSMVCTHQNCLINADASSANQAYVCSCHGSQFDKKGKVLTGPASQDLPWYETSLTSEEMLEVNFAKLVSADVRLKI